MWITLGVGILLVAQAGMAPSTAPTTAKTTPTAAATGIGEVDLRELDDLNDDATDPVAVRTRDPARDRAVRGEKRGGGEKQDSKAKGTNGAGIAHGAVPPQDA